MRVWARTEPKPGTVGDRVREAVLDAIDGDTWRPIEGPVVVRLRFVFSLPADASIPVAGTIAQSLPPAATTAPSVPALVRAILDELAGLAYLDERQIVALHAGKEYGHNAGVELVL